MRTRVKVCCMADRAEVRRAARLGADLVGIVGPMPSGPGTLTDAQSRDVAASVPLGTSGVLLSSEADGPALADHVRRVGEAALSAIQVVAHVDPSAHDHLGEALPSLRRIQVVHVENRSAVGIARQYAGRVHALLLDSGRPDAGELGGTGRVHDWSVSAEIARGAAVPVYLAGGLTPHNVGAAIRAVRPDGVDLCSGVRTDGALDGAKLSAFMAAVAEADRTA